MNGYLPKTVDRGTRVMVFVDGENLTLRLGAVVPSNGFGGWVTYEKDVLAWSHYLNVPAARANVVRTHYYTSVTGDDQKRQSVCDSLKQAGIHAPRVFARTKARNSKGVDIALCTEMLTHAFRRNFEVAVLVAGDGDYVRLIEAVAAEGRQVVLWAPTSGLSRRLRMAADHYFNLDDVFLAGNSDQLSSLWQR